MNKEHPGITPAPPNEGAAVPAQSAPVAADAAAPAAETIAPPPAAEPTLEPTLENAVAILKQGGLVAFPTETVYGLGADAANPAAMERLYKVKGRPKAHPVIVHIARREQLADWALEVSRAAKKLAEAFWPGPLTLIVKRAAQVSDLVTGGQGTVGVRVPAHPVARQLLEAFGGGIAAPSANRFGKVSPTTAGHVHADLGADVGLVLDGGACEVGIESTIVDVSGEAPRILRPGRITAADIERVLGEAPVTMTAAAADAPRVPGSHAVHYAPRVKLRLATRREIIDALIANKGRRIAVLALEVSVPRHPPALTAVAPAVSAQYAKALYANLRALDASGADLILVETPPDMPGWAGVRDRLRRAATDEPAKKGGKSRAAEEPQES